MSRLVPALLFLVSMTALIGCESGSEAQPSRVLYEQTDVPGDLYAPAWHETDGDDSRDTEAADDFVIPVQSGGWTLRRLYIPGVLTGATWQVPNDILQSVNVRFYADQAGSPDKEVASEMNLSPTINDQGRLTIDLPGPVDLRPGTYWLSVQGNLALTQGHYWNWRFRSTVSNAPAVIRNPANGLGHDCISWSRVGACQKGAAVPLMDDPDLLFRIEGTLSTPSGDPRTAYLVVSVVVTMVAVAAVGRYLRRRIAR